MPYCDESTRWRRTDLVAAAVILLIAGAVVYVMAERFITNRTFRPAAPPPPEVLAEMQRNANAWDRHRDELERQARERARKLAGRWWSESAVLEVTEVELSLMVNGKQVAGGDFWAGSEELALRLPNSETLVCPYRLASGTLELTLPDGVRVFVRED